MSRVYTNVKIHEKEILKMKKCGKTNREIAEFFGFKSKSTVKDFIKRLHRKERKATTVIPNKKGRPKKNSTLTVKELLAENKQLKMENDLLRDFLKRIERG